MICEHIDIKNAGVARDVEDFEASNGKMEDFITEFGLRCNRCEKLAEKNNHVRFVITEKREVIWWHKKPICKSIKY